MCEMDWLMIANHLYRVWFGGVADGRSFFFSAFVRVTRAGHRPGLFVGAADPAKVASLALSRRKQLSATLPLRAVGFE